MNARVPTAIARLQQTKTPWQLRQRELKEPKPEPVEHVPAPPEMSEMARRHWDFLVPHLTRCGLLTVIDVHTLQACCEEWATYLHCHEKIRQIGPVIADKRTKQPRINPYYKAAQHSLDKLIRMWKALGMTPQARAGIEVDTALARAVTPANDPWAVFAKPTSEIIDAEVIGRGG